MYLTKKERFSCVIYSKPTKFRCGNKEGVQDKGILVGGHGPDSLHHGFCTWNGPTPLDYQQVTMVTHQVTVIILTPPLCRSEIFPNWARDTALCITTFTNWLGNSIISQVRKHNKLDPASTGFYNFEIMWCFYI